MSAEARMEWLALHQGRNGALVQRDGGYVDSGSPVPDLLAQTYDRLIRQGLLALGELSAGGQRKVEITTAGQARYEELVTRAHVTGNGSGP